uniref:Uncharacterized protein n=1 Tax=Tetranychus urticae TaxID=32264 RepID=T1K1H7_TETUR
MLQLIAELNNIQIDLEAFLFYWFCLVSCLIEG